MDNIPDNIIEAVKNAAPEGRINCAAARELAERLGVDFILIGKAADELKIKIKNCQLGCF